MLPTAPGQHPIYAIFVNSHVELALHPDNPIGTSNSVGIQATFVGLFLLVGLAAGLLVWRNVGRDSSSHNR